MQLLLTIVAIVLLMVGVHYSALQLEVLCANLSTNTQP